MNPRYDYFLGDVKNIIHKVSSGYPGESKGVLELLINDDSNASKILEEIKKLYPATSKFF